MPVPPGCAFLIEPVPDDVFVLEDFGEEARAMARTAEEFVDREVLPRLDEIEEKKDGVMPDLLRRAGELGLLMIDVPEAYGGLGLDKTTSMLVSERAAKLRARSASRGARTPASARCRSSTTAPRRRSSATCRSSPPASGSPPTRSPSRARAATRSPRPRTARRDGDHWVLTGTKQFITNAGFADLFTVFAKVGRREVHAPSSSSAPTRASRPAPRSRSSASAARRPASSSSRTRAVPADRLLGEIGRGHKIAFNILNIGRFKLGAGALGAAEECLRVALDYARERKQFGQPIASFGMIQRKLADMATRIYVADSMSYRTAGLMDAAAERRPGTRRPSTTRVCCEAIEEYTIEARS